ncbi:molybdopterin molybdenumtransferase MoeA [Chromobacterium sp. ATCC 53434]|uniref:molybdopterin molybdotransferase MoeA n=1 Tax=Chromobacterium sp. (strain ATCC 53434 / SC 14030) TaxID=2059672 RepID=UPI000C763102|nr:gephyrin-like molybdotransferase Glp [Chromobacterium sp. ATCC 53434]AUH51908.1 molybdopterin molybdenumtransferase MoeA [Chromobacterium sp. ATCC 53434]
MLSFDDAQRLLAAYAEPVAERETVSLAAALGRVLAEDVTAALDLPPSDNSAMDGYALRQADWRAGAGLVLAGRCFAGEAPPPLPPGAAIRLFTGSQLPDGADAVAMQEDAEERDGRVHIGREPRPGQHVRRRGEDVAAGRPLLSAGALLGPAHIAMLAAQGMAGVPVSRRLRAGILTNGDELAPVGAPLGPRQIYNSNAAMLAALLAGIGVEVADCRHAPDDEAALRRDFAELGAGCDLVFSVGGASVGERDLVKPALAALGAELDMWRVRMKPGKPVALARLARTPVLCLPGNPVSAFVVFALLATPLIRRMQGRAETMPPVARVALQSGAARRDIGREDFLRVRLERDGAGAALVPFASQGAAMISSLPWASGLARLPAGSEVCDGDAVDYYDFARWLA